MYNAEGFNTHPIIQKIEGIECEEYAFCNQQRIALTEYILVCRRYHDIAKVKTGVWEIGKESKLNARGCNWYIEFFVEHFYALLHGKFAPFLFKEEQQCRYQTAEQNNYNNEIAKIAQPFT